MAKVAVKPAVVEAATPHRHPVGVGQTSGGQGFGGYESIPTDTLSQIPEQVNEGTPSSPTSTETPGEGTLSPGAPSTADIPVGTGPDGSTDPNGTTEDDIPTPSTGDTTGPSDPASPEETDGDDTPEPDAGEVPNDPDNPTSPENYEDDPPESGTGS